MTDLRTIHEDHGAKFTERSGREVVARYRRPGRTHRAVRNGVGAIEMPYGVLEVTGDDRIEYVDDVVTNRVPRQDGTGTYSLLLDPQGRIETDLYIYNATDRLLILSPPGRAAGVESAWEVFIEDVEIEVLTADLTVVGLHGPQATEKIASVLTGDSAPGERLSFVRGSLGEAGVTVVRTDAPAGETGYEVICAREDGAEVFDALLNYGLNAVPVGYETWNALTLEAGTPLFEPELSGRIPNEAGVRNGLDFEKGCFVGQEVVSRIENRGHPASRLVGLRPDSLPDPGAAVFEADSSVGEVTRAVESPMCEGPVALAYMDFDAGDDLSVRVEGAEVPAERVVLPFVEGSEASARLPQYE